MMALIYCDTWHYFIGRLDEFFLYLRILFLHIHCIWLTRFQNIVLDFKKKLVETLSTRGLSKGENGLF